MVEVRGPNIRVPPAFFVAGFLVGLWLEASAVRLRLVSTPALTQALSAAGWTIAVLGLLFSLWGIATFRRAHTTIFPFEAAAALVERGPYRFTRNPMYVGMTLSYTGIAIAMNVVWPILILPAVLMGVYFLVIRVEEKYLGERFGDAYAQYRKRVRRWI